MAKTNFTKVEEALRDALDKMFKESLLEEADLAQGKNPTKQHLVDQLVAKIRQEIKTLHKQDKEIFFKLGIDEKIIHNLLASSKPLTQKDWETLQAILKKIELYRTELEKTFPKPTDEELIEQESKKHINKRFNVNDKWLPLK